MKEIIAIEDMARVVRLVGTSRYCSHLRRFELAGQGAAVIPSGADRRGGQGAAGPGYWRNAAAPADSLPPRCAR